MSLLQGNTYRLPVKIFQITNGNIEFVEKAQFIFDDLNKYYTLTDSEVLWDNVKERFIVLFSQEETFSMPELVKWQVRIKYTNGQVDGTKVKETNVFRSITSEVL